jgi:LmbE family N-acetylglucosaminyl deacetylase
VHDVAVRAARLANTPRLLQATVPREPIAGVCAVLRATGVLKPYAAREVRGAGVPRATITHRIDVRAYADTKRAALACHRTQIDRANRSGRLFELLTRAPEPLIALAFGREYFVETALPPAL